MWLGRLAHLAGKLQGFPAYRWLARRVRPDIEIREPSQSDVDLIPAALGLPPPKHPYRPDSNVTNYVACANSSIVGFVQLVRFPKERSPYEGYWLFSLEVRFRQRGAGIGRMLTRKVIERATLDGANELSLLVYARNRPAVRLYEKLGFQRVQIPGLEEDLEKEAGTPGGRRIAMRLALTNRDGASE